MSRSKLFKKMFSLTLLVLVLAGCGGAPAKSTATPTPIPSPKIEGTLTNQASGEPLVGARVVLCQFTDEKVCTVQPDLTGITDEEGRFHVADVGLGRYVVLYNGSGEKRTEWQGLQLDFTPIQVHLGFPFGMGYSVLLGIIENNNLEGKHSGCALQMEIEKNATKDSGYLYFDKMDLAFILVDSEPISVDIQAATTINLSVWNTRDEDCDNENFEPITGGTLSLMPTEVIEVTIAPTETAAAPTATPDFQEIEKHIQTLREGDKDARMEAAFALGDIGCGAKSAVPVLVETLDDDYDSVRMAAIYALGRIGPGAKDAVVPLTEILESESGDAILRESACSSLGDIGPEAESAIPVLINALDDESEFVVLAAHYALARNNSDTQDHIAALETGLEDSDGNIRIQSVWYLEKIGDEAKITVPSLIELLEDENSNIQESALRALQKITGKDFGSDQDDWYEWWESNQNE